MSHSSKIKPVLQLANRYELKAQVYNPNYVIKLLIFSLCFLLNTISTSNSGSVKSMAHISYRKIKLYSKFDI